MIIQHIVGREACNTARIIKETMFIRVNDSSLNRNLGKFQLSHIWDEVCRTPPHSISSNTLLQPLHNGLSLHIGRAYNFTLVSMGLPWGFQPSPWHHVSPQHTCFGAIYGKYSLLQIMFLNNNLEFAWRKLVYDNQNNSVRAIQGVVLIIIGYKTE